MMDTKQRIEWIDVAKGIGMLLVILGHTIQLNIVTPLYAFHMPLFFFLSGLLIKSDTLTFLPYVKKMSLRLLRPWIIMLFISFLVCMCIPQWRDKYTLEAVLMDFYTCNTNIFQNSSLWYLPCFFFALMFFYWLNKWCQEGGHRHIYMFIGYAVIMLFIKQIVELLSLPTSRLPFKMDTALLAMVFIAVAFWWRNYIFELVVKPPKKRIVSVTIVAMIATAANGWANMNSLDFGRVRLLYFPVAFSGIMSVCLVSYYICKIKMKPIKHLLMFYGRNSMIIFGFQSLYIRLYLLFFNEFAGADMELYANNPWFHQIGSFLVVSFILSPLTVLFFSCLRKKGLNIL